jgi:ATP-binding cassette, subfamily B, bacterial
MFAGLDTESYDRTYNDRELVRRVGVYFARDRKRLLWSIVLIIALAVVTAVQPLVVAEGVNLLGQNPAPAMLIALVAVSLAIGLFIWGANWLRRRLLQRITGMVMSDLRVDAFEAVMNHDMSFFDQYRSGRIISRITTDTQEFSQVVVLITDIISQMLSLVILAVVLFTISWQLTLGVLGISVAIVLVAFSMRNLARRVTRRGFRAIADVNASIQEAVTGISVAKNFRQEAAIYGEFRRVNRQSYDMNLRRGFVLSNVFPVLNMVGGVGTALLVYFGGLSAAAGVITYGAWYLFITSVDRFWFPMAQLSAFWSQVQAGLSASERIFALIDAESTVRQKAAVQPGRLHGEIEFKQVDFRYTAQEQVLSNFNLHIAPGEGIALVGHTGAGKSSLGKLIARFYEFQNGQISIDGVDIRDLDLAAYRRQLGIVSQAPFLFDGTVADNIRYARPEATDEEILAIARQVGGGEWLDTLPDGMHTQVGERGNRLSMGQRQLVALMRVLVQEPAIFILDEATASIDPFTEQQIQQAINLILARSTSIVIAHRLSTVRAVSRIIVLDKGSIIEQGSHKQLMAQGGHYATLYDTYFRHQSLSYIEQVGQRRRERAFTK